MRGVDDILGAAAGTLDFGQPIAVMLLAILQYIPESDDPYQVVSRLMAAVPPGSHLVISHPARDINAEEVAESMREYNERSPEQATPRSHAEVSRFFAGLELVSPGLVAIPQWRPDSPPPPGSIAMWGGSRPQERARLAPGSAPSRPVVRPVRTTAASWAQQPPPRVRSCGGPDEEAVPGRELRGRRLPRRRLRLGIRRDCAQVSYAPGCCERQGYRCLP